MSYHIHSASKGKITQKTATSARDAVRKARALAREGGQSTVFEGNKVVLICGPAGKPNRSKGATWCKAKTKRFKKLNRA